MKTIFKSLFFFVALSALYGCAQSDFPATKARAEAGDAEAQYKIGSMYEYGTSVAQNYQEAVKWYRLAAEQGNAISQTNLGRMYERGVGVAKNYQEAVKWYRLAAEQGDAISQINLGRMYANGEGVAENAQEAVKWYRLAAAKGYTEAQNNLRLMYEYDSGLAQKDQALEAVREYFIDGLVIIHTEKKVSSCDKGGDYTIRISGDIGPDSSFAIEEILKTSPNCINQNGVVLRRTVVNLSSAGGLIEDGYKMGQFFRANGVHTQIDDDALCASSCAIAYLGGVERTMSEDAVIMFHSPYLLELNARGERVPNCDVGSESSAKLLSYYQEMTGDEEGQRLMDRTLSYCSADDGWVLKGSNAAELFGIATKL